MCLLVGPTPAGVDLRILEENSAPEQEADYRALYLRADPQHEQGQPAASRYQTQLIKLDRIARINVGSLSPETV